MAVLIGGSTKSSARALPQERHLSFEAAIAYGTG